MTNDHSPLDLSCMVAINLGEIDHLNIKGNLCFHSCSYKSFSKLARDRKQRKRGETNFEVDMVAIYVYDSAAINFFIFLKNVKLELAQQPFYWKLFYKNVQNIHIIFACNFFDVLPIGLQGHT